MAKILVVANFLVPPIHAGSCRCIAAYTSLLKEMGHDVYFLYSGRDAIHKVKEAKTYWGDRFLHYEYSQMLRGMNLIKRKLIDACLRGYTIDYFYPVYGLSAFVSKAHKRIGFDAIIINYPWMSPLLPKVDIKKKYIFTHDCFTYKRERIKENMYSLSPNQEAKALRRADVILSIQDNESLIFRYLLPDKPVYSVYMPIVFKPSPVSCNKNILFFSGNSDINRNGLNFFIREVFPLITVLEKDAKLVIAGSICRSLSINDSRISVLGFIDDVDAFYASGNVVINPVYQGTGLKIKTIEAISYGKAIVVHPHSVDGLYKHYQAPVFVAHTAQQYADHIFNILQGRVNIEKHAQACKEYIDEMNGFIKRQYEMAGF